MTRPPNIALLIEVSSAHARGLLRGVSAYSQAEGPWRLHLMEQLRVSAIRRALDAWEGDGLIARVETDAIAEVLVERGLPVVNVSGTSVVAPWPQVDTDNDAVCRMAAGHLIDRGYHHFGFCGMAHYQWSGWRRDYFAAELSRQGMSCSILELASLTSNKGYDPVFYTNSGSGVGGGLVTGGRIYHGAVPGEVEFGHLRLDHSGRTVERVCSGWAVNWRIREFADSAPDSKLASLLPDKPGDEAKCLSQALAEEDRHALQIVDETSADLAFALSHVVHLFHPEVIVLGGGLALIGEPWRAAAARHLPRHLMDGFAPGPAVRLASLGEHVVPIGILHLAGELLRKRSSPTMS